MRANLKNRSIFFCIGFILLVSSYSHTILAQKERNIVLQAAVPKNDVRILTEHDKFLPESNRGIIVYGVGLEEGAAYKSTIVILDRYNLKTNKIIGSCDHYDHTKAQMNVEEGKNKKYFVFDAPAGYYVYSPTNGRILNDHAIFKIDANKINYLGDFIETNRVVKSNTDGKITLLKGPLIQGLNYPLVDLRYNMKSAKDALIGFKFFKGNLVKAAKIKVKKLNPVGFLCTP